MPVNGQIIPKYTISHIETYINDNSVYTPTTETIESGIRGICVFTSSRGRDNKILFHNSLTNWYKEYGTPNFRLHGQANLMPYAILSSGYGNVWSMRIMPEDATYAGVIFGYHINVKSIQDPAKAPDWVTSTTEKLVLFNSKVYKSTGRNINLTPDPSAATGDWTEVTTWVGGTSYTVGDYAIVGTVIYKCIISNSNATFVAEDWEATFSTQEPAPAIQKVVKTPISKQITGSSFNDLKIAVTAAENMSETSGFYPVIAFYSQGRGTYGNAFSIRMGRDTVSNKENDYQNYTLEVLSSENSSISKLEGFNNFTLLDDCFFNNESLFIEDKVNDEENGGSSQIFTMACEEGIEKLLGAIKTALPNENPTLDIDTFEPLFGLAKDGTNQFGADKVLIGTEDVTIDSKTYSPEAVDSATGIKFGLGSDGNIGLQVYNSDTQQMVDNEEREAKINALYLSAFSGELNKGILSKRRCPAEFIMDANFPEDVKKELINLIIKRSDCFGYIDAGVQTTTRSLLNWAKQMANIGNRLFSKNSMNYVTRDPFTNKKINVTETYFLAGIVPSHFANNGRHIAMVGEDYTKLQGHVKDSVLPEIDADDLDFKQELAELGVNCWECTGENVYQRSAQNTSQFVTSDLTEESNMHTLLQLKREIEAMVSSLTYNFAEAEDRARFTESADRLLANYRGKSIRTGTVKFEMTPFEEQRAILHCYLEIVYKTIFKTGIIEIDINPRTSSAS